MQFFKIAACQMNVINNKQKNIDNAIKQIKLASFNNATLVTLPEMFTTPYTNDKFIEYSESEIGSITLEAMCDIANKESIYLQAGSIPEKMKNKLYNTAYLINPDGKIVGKHRKMHMFDINTDSIKFTESDTLTPGDKITVIDTAIAKIGIAICYDIRFPEMWTLMSKKGADIILLPGAFNKTTGPAHWETLIRSRAIDNQLYVVATSPSQVENSYYTAWGHSMIVDPWGKILSKASNKEEIIYSIFDFEKINSIKKQLPIIKNKRIDVYQTVEKDIKK